MIGGAVGGDPLLTDKKPTQAKTHCRAALAARDYTESCQTKESHTRKKLTKQSWAIAGKIKQVDDAIMPPHQSSLIHECRPWVFCSHSVAPVFRRLVHTLLVQKCRVALVRTGYV